jgi:BASS family bile acid:Na+ symporter
MDRLGISHRRPDLAARWLGPAVAIGKVLNAATLALILTSQSPRMLDVRRRGLMVTLILLGASLGAGWIAGGQRSGDAIGGPHNVDPHVGLGLVITANGATRSRHSLAFVFDGIAAFRALKSK